MSIEIEDGPVADLLKEMEERGLSVSDATQVVRAMPQAGRGRLSDHERGVLEAAGARPGTRSRRAVATGALRRHELERECLTTEDVAAMLGRADSRVRQRLSGPNRSLLGFHRSSGRGEWLLPRFQFELGIADLAVWARLLRTLPPADDTSPLVLVAWLTEPQEHLGGRSRAQVLADGDDVGTLLEEAESFGIVP